MFLFRQIVLQIENRRMLNMNNGLINYELWANEYEEQIDRKSVV